MRISDELSQFRETFNESIRESFFIANNLSFWQKLKKKLLKIPFSLYFFIIIILLMIITIIYYIYFYMTKEPNFRLYKPQFEDLILNNRAYEGYLFDNGLEVLLIYDSGFDRDGGAIVIEKGYYDNPGEEGLSTFASILLSQAIYEINPEDRDTLENYYGNFKSGTDEIYMNFRFDILNNGFKKFLKIFCRILNFDTNIDENKFNMTKHRAKQYMQLEIERRNRTIEYRENHLLEYLVYGFKNENNGDILPEGNPNIINEINTTEISNYIKDFINPSKIKIVLFSKYKFSISSKYMKYYFKYLINMPKKEDNNNSYNETENKIFNTSQIIYIKANDYELNYIKIIYYIDRIDNESFSELNFRKRYLYYIRDIIRTRKEGSLYSLFKSKIKSIDADVSDVLILKSKIQFSIQIELNNLQDINDIIYATYQYMHKIISEIDEKGIQNDRYNELFELCDINATLTEKTFDTIELAKSNAIHLIETKNHINEYFHWYCLPTINENNTKKYYDEMESYVRQLSPNNSVVILAIRDKDKNKLTCNNESNFYINCEYFINDSNFNNTFYYNVYYKNDIFNSTQLDEYLNKDKDINYFNITFEKNKFRTQCKDPINDSDIETNLIKFDYKNTLNSFYFKRNLKFRVPRLLIKFNLYHPYLRQNNYTDENEKRCYYFLLMEMFSAIKRRINEELYEALSAYAQIKFYQSENHLDILVFCFSDQAYNITKAIKEIIYDTDWESSDFFDNNEIYKNEAFDDYFIFDKLDIITISRFYFNCELKNNLYNKYEFFPDEFEKNYYEQCINDSIINKKNILKNLTTFIMDIYIYGNYTEEESLQIFDLFNRSNFDDFSEILVERNISTSADNYTIWVKEILDINGEINKTINGSIYNKSIAGNIGISYRIFKDISLLDISIFNMIIDVLRTRGNSLLISQDIFKYKNFIFELVFSNKNNNLIIPNENLVINELENLLNSNESLTWDVDIIGTRLYYLIKNFILTLEKKQTSLYKKGLGEIEESDFNGNAIDPFNIISDYKNVYTDDNPFDKGKLDNLINMLKGQIKNNQSRINIFTSGS